LTSSQVLAAASELLVSGGYSVVPTPPGWEGTVRLFEDPYGIVALHLYETWDRLIQEWHVAQGELVDLISEHLSRPEPKAWEGYLVVFTTGLMTGSDRTSLTDLRYDTNRVRKLVSTGEELETLDDVRTALLPLLPLDPETPPSERAGVLEMLPDLMTSEDVPRHVIEVLVDAFVNNASIVERLHESRERQS
jgi:hypothetical protein